VWGAQPCPLEHVLHDEEAARVRSAFALLPAGDRELLELRVVAGLSYEDVAAALGKRPASVRMAQSRALSRLRKHLEGRP
jgi:RNA polymerase sigma-70 factor (ECF subfamily)